MNSVFGSAEPSYREGIQVVIDHVVAPGADQHLPHHHIQAQPGSQAQLIQPPVHHKSD